MKHSLTKPLISGPTVLEPGDRLRVGAMVFELVAPNEKITPSRSRAAISTEAFSRPKSANQQPSEGEIHDWLSKQDTAELGIEVLEAVNRAVAQSSSSTKSRDRSEISSVTTSPQNPSQLTVPEMTESLGERQLPPNRWTIEAAEIIRQHWEKKIRS